MMKIKNALTNKKEVPEKKFLTKKIIKKSRTNTTTHRSSGTWLHRSAKRISTLLVTVLKIKCLYCLIFFTAAAPAAYAQLFGPVPDRFESLQQNSVSRSEERRVGKECSI